MLIYDAIKVSVFGTLMVFLVLAILYLFIRFPSIILHLIFKSIEKMDESKQDEIQFAKENKKIEDSNQVGKVESFLFTIDTKIYSIEVEKLKD